MACHVTHPPTISQPPTHSDSGFGWSGRAGEHGTPCRWYRLVNIPRQRPQGRLSHLGRSASVSSRQGQNVRNGAPIPPAIPSSAAHTKVGVPLTTLCGDHHDLPEDGCPHHSGCAAHDPLAVTTTCQRTAAHTTVGVPLTTLWRQPRPARGRLPTPQWVCQFIHDFAGDTSNL